MSNSSAHAYPFSEEGVLKNPVETDILEHSLPPSAQGEGALTAWLAAIVNSSDDAILSKDLNGIITSWNNAAERIFGYTAQEAIGQPITLLMPPDRFNEEPGILARLRRGQRIDHYETVRRRKDGSLINISLTVSPIRDAQGSIIGASKIARDITQRKRDEEALREAKQRLAALNEELVQAKANLESQVQARTAELRRSNDQLEELIHTIAHDLRAPLRAMQAFATFLSDEYAQQLDQTARDYCQRIVGAAGRMDALVRDLLVYGRVSRAEAPLAAVDVQPAWQAALAQNEAAVRETKARIAASTPLAQVVAHHSTLVQVLANLLSNALKFVAPNVTPDIQFWAEQPQPDMVRLNIRDNGIGIAPQYLQRMFRVFERLTGDQYPGTGIGLSIVRRGVERMGGKVGVQSTLGQGSRFWIELRKAR